VESLKLPAADCERMLYGNAKKLLKL